MALTITNQNFDQLKNDDKPLVVDFWAQWCGPCRMLGPVIEELAKEYEGRINIGKCDIDEYGSLATSYNVRSVPTIVFIKDGEAKQKLVGVQSKEDLRKVLDSLL